MTLALVLSSNGAAAPPLHLDLQATGFETASGTDYTHLIQDVILTRPDVVICFEHAPDAAFFGSLVQLGQSSAQPVIVFTTDPDADKIGQALRSGVHAYIVDGYSRARLRSIVHLAQARFEQVHAQQRELADLRTRFEERKLVDRAKGILMGARHMREEEAFKALRDTAMASKQRIGQVSQTVIETARFAEAMNRAGQLRMLSQRLVKFYALACTGAAAGQSPALLAESVAQADAILALLDRILSRKTFGDLVAALAAPWASLKAALAEPCQAARLDAVDGLAEEFLELAERLTANLEVAAYAPALGVINTVGRQRMLSQKLAKLALVQWLTNAPPTAASRHEGETVLAEFLAGLDYLNHLPLSNTEIARELAATMAAWQRLEADIAGLRTSGATMRVAESSEVLLGRFDALTDLLERGIQAFVC